MIQEKDREYTFIPSSPENRLELEQLTLYPFQEGFIETVEECLREADQESRWCPVGIYFGGELIGFAMYGVFDNRLWLDRYLIDQHFQKKGHGKGALLALLDFLQRSYAIPEIYLSIYEENQAALSLYEKMGFEFNGELDVNGEKVMVKKFASRDVPKASKKITMTEGNIWLQILAFSIPLLIGNLFQQLYNTVDSIVVGNYVGKEALAAVGSSASLINLIIGMFTGIATGAGVLIAQYYGARDEKKLEWSVHTAMSLSVIGGVILTAAGYFLSGMFLQWMGTPEAVMPNSTLYLKVFFLGSVFNLVYNMGAGILRAVGDSRHPLYYLCVASGINIALDLLFVIVLKLGVAGVGFATISAQAVSAFLVIQKLIKSEESYRLDLKKIGIDRRMASRIIRLGVPSGLQTSIISLSNVVVQSNINSFGDVVMAGCGAYGKIDGFIMLPIGSFSMAAMTFIGQNIGAGKKERVKQGMAITSIISIIYIGMVSVILLNSGEGLLSLFSKDSEVIKYGMVMLHILMPFYAFIAVCHVICGGFRGAGRSMASMMILVLNLCVVRMIWVNIMTPLYPRIETVLLGYPITWVTGIICCILYAWKGNWMELRE